MSNLENVLEKIGFSSEELKVYQVIIAFGFRTAGQISSYTQLPISKVTKACSSLVDRNYLKKVTGISEEGSVFIPLAPKISISSNVSKDLTAKLENLSIQISDLWSESQKTIDHDSSNLISTIQTTFENYEKSLTQLNDERKTSYQKANDIAKNTLDEFVQISSDTFQEQVTTPLQKISDSLKDFNKDLQEFIQNTTENIHSSSDSQRKLIDDAVSYIKSELGEFSDEIGLIATGRISGLSQQIEGDSASSTENGEKIITSITTYLEQLITDENELISKASSEFIQGIMDEYKSKQQEILGILDSIEIKYAETIGTSQTSGEEAKKESIGGSKELLSHLSLNQIDKVKDLETSLLGAVETVQQQAVEQLGNVLTQTSDELSVLETGIKSNLKKNEKKLQTDLGKLEKNLSKALTERFKEISDKMSGFADSLKSNSTENVDELIGFILGLKEFLQSFLGESETSFDDQLKDLQSQVNVNLEEIVENSNNQIQLTIEKNETNTNKIRENINKYLSDFANSTGEFLKGVKQNLNENLTSAREKFTEGVETGVQVYEAEASKRQEEQVEQLNDINREVGELSESVDSSRKTLIEFNENYLQTQKNETLDKIHENSTATV
ncbi:MAG: helix-turn-helix domain-containing protein, partial [Candidatus Hodarchaeales archaeon]